MAGENLELRPVCPLNPNYLGSKYGALSVQATVSSFTNAGKDNTVLRTDCSEDQSRLWSVTDLISQVMITVACFILVYENLLRGRRPLGGVPSAVWVPALAGQRIRSPNFLGSCKRYEVICLC